MTDTPQWAYGVERLVVFSGAGISTDSGIPDFRGPSGAWTKDPGSQHRHTYAAFLADPELRASYWKSRHEHEVWTAEPNASHYAVAKLAESGIDTTVVTQNTDGLHQRAGTPADRVFELHGTMHETECIACGLRCPTVDVLARIGSGDATPACPRCGGILKTASTMFGQTMATDVFADARRAVSTCDLVLAVGTTLTVEPAGSLCASAVRTGVPLVIVNLGDTAYDSIATEIFHEPLADALTRIVGQLRDAVGVQRPAAAAASTASPSVRPSGLLRAGARTARLRSRAEELQRLTTWCAGDGVRSHLLWGPAGVGKTRLALELADRLGDDWDVEFLPLGDAPAPTSRPCLVVLDDAESRLDEVGQLLASARGPMRLLLLSRTEEAAQAVDTSEQLTAPDTTRVALEEAARHAALDYAAALDQAAGLDRVGSLQPSNGDTASTPGDLQAAVLAGLLDLSGATSPALAAQELAYLRHSASSNGLALSAEVVDSAVATAILCGADDETSATTALIHLPALAEAELRARVARWLREVYPPDGSAYWLLGFPDVVAENVVAALVTPRFLVGMLSETTPQQDRRVLNVLARAAATRPALARCLTQLLSVLPGMSPAAVEVALRGGHPATLVEALTTLVHNVALPVDLLAELPPGTTLLGKFPVLLAQSLVEAYEMRVAAHPTTVGPGLVAMLLSLSERLADTGRMAESLAAAQRAADVAGGLPERADLLALSVATLERAHERADQGRDSGGDQPTTRNGGRA